MVPGDGTIGCNCRRRLLIDDEAGACLLDFAAVFDDGTSLVRCRANVCKFATFTYELRIEDDSLPAASQSLATGTFCAIAGTNVLK